MADAIHLLAQATVGLIRGKWTIPVLVHMVDGPIRLGQLCRLMPQVNKKVIVQQLHELEAAGIITRNDLSGKTRRVEYKIADEFGPAVLKLLGLLSDWGIQHLGEDRYGRNASIAGPAFDQDCQE